MLRLNLGGGAVAFEIEGEADRVGSLDPNELAKRNWPAEVVENYRRYRLAHSNPSTQALTIGIENAMTSAPAGGIAGAATSAPAVGIAGAATSGGGKLR